MEKMLVTNDTCNYYWAVKSCRRQNQIKIGKRLKFGFESVGNIPGKGENAGYQHIMLFPHCFSWPQAFIMGLLKVENICKRQKQM